MNQWYELTASLETAEPALEETALNRILQTARAALPKKRRWKLAVVVAAILLLTACGVAAATYTRWFGSMANDPFEPEASEDVLASMGTVIDQTQTVDGVTVTLHGALWDGRVLLLSLSAEGDAVPENVFGIVESEGSWVSWSKKQTERYLLAQGNVPENEIQAYLDHYEALMADNDLLTLKAMYNAGTKETVLVATGEMGSEMPETELTLHLEDLWGAGPFQFDFSIVQNQSRMVYSGQVPVKLSDGTALTVTEVLLTPLRAEVRFRGDGELGPGTMEALRIGGLETDQQVFTYRSGNTWIDNEDGTWEGELRLGPLERVIDPAQVTGVYLGDQLLELDKLSLKE